MSASKPDKPSLPPKRSFKNTLVPFVEHVLWFFWDGFWRWLNLDSVGDDVREHAKLTKTRAAVACALIVVLFLGGCGGWYLQSKSTAKLQSQLTDTQTKLRDIEPAIHQLQQTTNELNAQIAEKEDIITNMQDSDARFHVIVYWSEDAFNKRHFDDVITLYREASELEIKDDPDHPVTDAEKVPYLASCYMTNQTTKGLEELRTNLDTLISDYSRNARFLGYFQGDLDKARKRLPTNAEPVITQSISMILYYKSQLTNQ